MSKPRPAFKTWLQTEEGYVFGPGVYRLLIRVNETGTIKQAAESLGMSYRYAWGLVRKAEERLGQPLLTAHKGGKSGGGGAALTEIGSRFLEEFSKIEAVIGSLLRSDIRAFDLGPVNQLKGVIREVHLVDADAEIVVDLEALSFLRLRLSQNLLDEMKLSEGSRIKVDLNHLVSSIRGITD